MHAYLIVGRDKKEIDKQINVLQKKLKVELFNFEVQKINDVRELNKIVQLEISKKTAIVIRNIDSATTAAVNAFLKNLEEPQEDLHYILTASNINQVLETVISRCQVITIRNNQKTSNKETNKFLRMKAGKQIDYLSSFRDREEAIKFTENLIESAHVLLFSNEVDYTRISVILTAAESTRNALSKNGNITLQLTNLVAQIN